MDTIESGKIINAIKGFINKIEKAFNTMDTGLSITDSEIRHNGTTILTITSGSDDVVKCKCVPLGDKTYNLYFKSPEGNQVAYEKVSQENIVKKCTDVIDEWYGATTEEIKDTEGKDLLECVRIKSKKIVGSKTYIEYKFHRLP